jgi:hypothetical protein
MAVYYANSFSETSLSKGTAQLVRGIHVYVGKKKVT